MMPFHKLMVVLVGNDSDADLIRYTSAITAKCSPLEINFVHVLPNVNTHQAKVPSYDEALEKIRAEVGKYFNQPATKTNTLYHVLRGERIDALLEFAVTHETDLILVGHHKQSRRATARRLAMKAPCSVWVVPEGSPANFDSILVPIDFSEYSADALSTAAILAARCNAREFFAIHVYFNEARTTYDEYDALIHGQEKEAFAKFIAPINLHGVEVKPLFEESANVAHAVERVAERQHVNLVVMGTRGRSRSAAVLLGSETEHVISESPIPVLAIKHFGARMNIVQTLLDKKFLHRGGNQYT